MNITHLFIALAIALSALGYTLNSFFESIQHAYSMENDDDSSDIYDLFDSTRSFVIRVYRSCIRYWDVWRGRNHNNTSNIGTNTK